MGGPGKFGGTAVKFGICFALVWLLILGTSEQSEAGCKLVTRGLKSYLKCTGDIARAAGDITQAAQDNIGKPLGEGVKAAGEGVAHLGDQIGRELGDAGRNINRAAIDAGHDINRAAIHAGKELEKAGQKIGEFLEWAVDFKLSCSDPANPPSSLAAPYQASCSGPLARFKQDSRVCVAAGGVSMIVAGTASSVQTFGASLALAKAAFELCEQACRRQRALEDCMAEVDAGATQAQQNAEVQAAETAILERRAEALQCRFDALNQEMLWRFGQTVQRCEDAPDCHPADPASADWIVRENEAILADVTARKNAAGDVFDAGGELDGKDYGPYIARPAAAEIALTTEVANRMPRDKVCHISGTTATFWTKVLGRDGQTVRHRWLYGDAQQEEFQLLFTMDHRIGSDAWRVWSTKTIPRSMPGKWMVVLVGPDDELLAHHMFLATPPPVEAGESS